jgi:hypothetical protein
LIKDNYKKYHNFQFELFKITVYAAYLYDAVMLYAKAAHEHLEEGGDIINGTAIIQRILGSNYVGKLKLNLNTCFVFKIFVEVPFR